MKFTSTFSALLVVLPLMAHVSGLAVPEGAVVARQRGGFGGKGAKAAPPAKGAATGKGATAGMFKVSDVDPILTPRLLQQPLLLSRPRPHRRRPRLPRLPTTPLLRPALGATSRVL